MLLIPLFIVLIVFIPALVIMVLLIAAVAGAASMLTSRIKKKSGRKNKGRNLNVIIDAEYKVK